MNYTNIHNSSDLFDIFPVCYQIRILSRPINWHDINDIYLDVHELYITVRGLDTQLNSVKEQLSDIKDRLCTYLR